MAWFYVLAAGVLEVGWAALLKASHGFTRPLPSVGTVAFMILSFVLLAQAMRSLPLGTAYAVWTGVGAVGAAVVGMAVMGDPVNVARVAGVGLILAGIVTLKLAA